MTNALATAYWTTPAATMPACADFDEAQPTMKAIFGFLTLDATIRSIITDCDMLFAGALPSEL